MSGVCYFILIKKPINFQFLKDFLILNYGDVLLLKHSEREFLQTYSDKYIEFELNDSAVRNYLYCYNNQGKQLLDKCP
ncbi:AraC family transcriptional regulator, partial [Escherichia fergusonii]|nr:AraC family transcriptional regulator [Escherichia fergusonii]